MSQEKYKKIAEEIIEFVGSDNILSATHCATRLRLIVKDREKIDSKAVEKIDEVKGTFYNSGQYQIILGTGIVNKVFAEVEQLNISTASKKEQDAYIKSQEKGVKALMRTLGDIFVPIVPVIAATGLFLGLKGVVFNDNILGLLGLSTEIFPSYLNQLVSVLTDTAFAFLPALITMSAFRVFGGTPMIGLVIGLMLVSPILPNAYGVASGDAKAIMVAGFLPVMGAQGSVVTAILTGFLGAKLERKLRQIMPNSLDLILTPFVTMLVMIVVALMGFAPIVHWLEKGLIALTQGLMNLPFGLGGFFVGATYPLAVITGLHHMYVVIETSLLANTGYNQLITLCAMYGFANLGACLAFYTSAKSDRVKQTVMGAFMSQLFGVSEPVLFGLHLRYNLKPLYMMLISSGFGAALLSLFHIQSNSYGLAVLPSYLMYIYDTYQVLIYFIVSLISMALCFVLTKLFAIPSEILIEDE
ncbi:PTS sugar transporter subunit IIA [Streptococcus penaeicida]|uniref:PTS sugar transporter subunit IIA n=1 Tax=Streptococcus penaeicida TaxID=1765960 RepID=A0A2N8LAF0_9STRE|nr:PTS transporter subunit EIIC [Streptococcus penaeicida]PND47133.1 PTS sugar transporter subunit IIA [Streptococcus penaeicida]